MLRTFTFYPYVIYMSLKYYKNISVADIKSFLNKKTSNCNNPQNIPKNLFELPIKELLIITPSIVYQCNYKNVIFQDFDEIIKEEYKNTFQLINLFLSTQIQKNNLQKKENTISSQEINSFLNETEPSIIKKYIDEVSIIINNFLIDTTSNPVVLKSKPKPKLNTGNRNSVHLINGGKKKRYSTRKNRTLLN